MDSYDARYTSWGPRTYGPHPVPVYRRSVWELQLVNGGAEPTFGLGEADRGVTVHVGPSGRVDRVTPRVPILAPDGLEHGKDSPSHGETSPSRSSTGEMLRLWVFRPASLHGWGAADHRASEVAVFHYDTVPTELDAVVGDAPWMCIAWHPGDHSILDRLADRLYEAARLLAPVTAPRPIASRRLRASSVLLDAAAACIELSTTPTRHDTLDPAHLVERAVAWFEAHMHDGVGVRDLAAALSVSPSTLSRSFHRTLHRSATNVLRERRMSRAAWLLRHGRHPIGEVAEVCGYRDQSAFSRAAHRYFGMSPGELRRRTSRVAGEANA